MNGGARGAVLTSRFQEVLNHRVRVNRVMYEIQSYQAKWTELLMSIILPLQNEGFHQGRLSFRSFGHIADPLKGHWRYMAAPSEEIGSIL